VNSDLIFLPLDPDKLRAGEVVNFSIYVKADAPGATKEEYSLFCRRGEIFNPGNFSKIKFSHVHRVYYHRRDKENVTYYLYPDASLLDNIQFLKKEKRLAAKYSIKKPVYIPIALDNITPDIRLNFDCFMKSKVITKMDYNYTNYISKGDMCRQALIDDLRRKGVNYLYFRKEDEAEVLKFLYHNLDLILKDESISPFNKAKLTYNAALLWADRFYYEKHIRTLDELKAGFKLIDYLLATLHQDQNYRQWLPGLRRHGEKLPAHSLNTCLLGLGFANYLGWPDEEVVDFAQGALLHDIGMMEIPETLLLKPGRLTAAEMELIKKHPRESCRIIKEIYALNLYSMVMILQHHESGDGSGYSQGLNLDSINRWARILRIIDSYEAMTSNRSWRGKFDSLDALQEMRQEWSARGTFDTNYLIDFIKFLSGS
jgi:HD-GYP domain-containing protein (c-di-GMP phosphodiesterase class II)